MTLTSKLPVMLAILISSPVLAGLEELKRYSLSLSVSTEQASTGHMNSRAQQKGAQSWSECIASAEQERSDRDLNFFRKARKLSNSRPWLVSHSINNEARFCVDISQCEALYMRYYSKPQATYPACQS